MSSLTHGVVALNSSTAVLINPDTASTNSTTGESSYAWKTQTVSIQNTDASAIVYIGASGVTSSSYGIQLTPGSSVTVDDLTPNMALYAISSTSSNVAVLQVNR